MPLTLPQSPFCITCVPESRFHVDKMSSAHVYLRLREGETIDDIPEEIVSEMAQLTKRNSIDGNKTNDVDVVYIMWGNLKKKPSMDAGQVSFLSGVKWG